MPDRGYRIDGSRSTGRYRLRQGFFGVALEELIERRGGSSQWRKIAVGDAIEIAPHRLMYPAEQRAILGVRALELSERTEADVIADLLKEAAAK